MKKLSDVTNKDNYNLFFDEFKKLVKVKLSYSQIVEWFDFTAHIKPTRTYEFIAKISVPTDEELRRIKLLVEMISDEFTGKYAWINGRSDTELTNYSDKHGV